MEFDTKELEILTKDDNISTLRIFIKNFLSKHTLYKIDTNNGKNYQFKKVPNKNLHDCIILTYGCSDKFKSDIAKYCKQYNVELVITNYCRENFCQIQIGINEN